MQIKSLPNFKLGLLAGAILLLSTACQEQQVWSSPNHATLTALNLLDSGAVCTVDQATTTTSTTTFLVLVGVGLLTGLSHCIGMCGPLVGAFVVRRRAISSDLSTPLVLFQTGRLTTYLTLGFILGSTGAVLIATIRPWQGVFSIGLGLFMGLLGLSLLGFLPLQKWLASMTLGRWVGQRIKQLIAADHPAAPFGLGLANGLLPCGPVYAMILLAAASGDPLRGATIMLVFGLGTLPAMLGVGLSTSSLSLRLRSNLYRVAAGLVMVVGLQLALRGFALSGQIPHAMLGRVMVW